MKIMFDQLLPLTIDNTYRGHKLALWLFGLLLIMKLAAADRQGRKTARVRRQPRGPRLDDRRSRALAVETNELTKPARSSVICDSRCRKVLDAPTSG